MIRISPKGNDINGILHRFPSLNASCESKSSLETFSKCINAVNISHDFHFCSGSSQNEWFLFHIPNIKLFVTHYSIQEPVKMLNRAYPIAWDLYGISDENEETLIDRVENSGLTQEERTKTYIIDKKGYYSKFKMIMTAKNENGELNFRIYKIDVFGIIYSFLPFIQRTPRHPIYSIVCFLFLLCPEKY